MDTVGHTRRSTRPARRTRLRDRVADDVNRRGGPGLLEVVALLADRERRVEHRDADRAAERPADDVGTTRLTLVEDDRGVVARGLCITRLDHEVTSAAL